VVDKTMTTVFFSFLDEMDLHISWAHFTFVGLELERNSRNFVFVSFLRLQLLQWYTWRDGRRNWRGGFLDGLRSVDVKALCG
jgi:hypothetical protein